MQARTIDDSVEISVSDKGPGIPKDIIIQMYSGEGRGGVGLKNVHRRLKSIYGEDNGLKIETSSAGSRVWFRVPRTTGKDKENC